MGFATETTAEKDVREGEEGRDSEKNAVDLIQWVSLPSEAVEGDHSQEEPDLQLENPDDDAASGGRTRTNIADDGLSHSISNRGEATKPE